MNPQFRRTSKKPKNIACGHWGRFKDYVCDECRDQKKVRAEPSAIRPRKKKTPVERDQGGLF